ncbi:hypothetical protein GCM10023063_15640 [Arthrobacter methylotrophus]|uniref:Uncharacterized protein n=1 Tax=Arthrobacter methylotrophus TaxID=121291 RepID=A0ABV5UQ69_9MICC
MGTRDDVVIAYEGAHHIMGSDTGRIRIWKQTWFWRRRIADFPSTPEGEQEAVAAFTALEPQGVLLPPPGRVLRRPTALTKAGMVLIAALGVVLIAVAALVPTMAGSTSATTVQDQNKNPEGGWEYTDSVTAMFLQWTRTSSTVKGSLAMVAMANSAAETVTTSNGAFTGTIDGDSATLSFTGLFGSSSNIAAQVQGDNLVLSLPLKDGTLRALTMKPAAATDYNQAVTTLQGRASTNHANQVKASMDAASAAAAQAAQVAAQSKADNAVDEAAARLSSAVYSATGDAKTVRGDDTSIASDLTSMQKDVSAVQTQADKVKKEVGTPAGEYGTTCLDAGEAGLDAGTVDLDAGTITRALPALSSDRDALAKDLAAIAATKDALTKAEASDPGHSPGGQETVPNDAAIASAISDGQAALDEGAATANSAPTSAAQLAQQAHSIADGAKLTGGC